MKTFDEKLKLSQEFDEKYLYLLAASEKAFNKRNIRLGTQYIIEKVKIEDKLCHIFMQDISEAINPLTDTTAAIAIAVLDATTKSLKARFPTECKRAEQIEKRIKSFTATASIPRKEGANDR